MMEIPAPRVSDELGALARANLDGIHGCIDSSTDAPTPCIPCQWCPRTGSPAAAILDEPAC